MRCVQHKHEDNRIDTEIVELDIKEVDACKERDDEMP